MLFKRRLRKDASIEIAPLIDIVFILLLFFVVTTTFKENPGLEIDLPETRETKGIETRDLVINIAPGDSNNAEQISFQNSVVTMEQLERLLKEELQRRSDRDAEERFVEIKADKNVRFEIVHQVVTLAKQTGASGVSFPAVTQRETESDQ
jgi:biopolymer transport protein ExbD